MKKILILLITVLLPIFSNAWNGTTSEHFSKTIPAGEFSCNLPAPANLVVSNISAHSATGTWSAVAGAVGYYVEVRVTSNNSLVYSNTTAALTETPTGLPAGEELTFYVAAICQNNEKSTEVASKGFTTDVVIDLIAANYGTPCEGYYTHETDIIYDVPGFDIFEGEIINGEEYWLEISQMGKEINPVSFYKIHYDEAGMTSYICDFQEFYNGQYTPIGNPNGENPTILVPDLFGIVRVSDINHGGDMIDIKLVGNNSELENFGYVQVKAIGSGWDEENGIYSIKLKSCTSKGGGGEQGRNRETGTIDWQREEKFVSGINVFPNPVQSTLNIQLPKGLEIQNDILIEMTNINGEIVFANRYSAISQIVKMNLSGFQTGMYFLKIETGNEVRVLKVVKSE